MAIEYPEPEVVASGEPLLLDLMVNPQTGETLRDLVRVTAPPPPSPLVRVVNGALNRNGRFVARTGTAWGRPALEIPDVGSFTLAFDRVDSGDCIAAKLRQDPTAAFEGVLSFEHGKDAYEWSSRDAIVVGRAAPAQLWLCRERAASPRKP